MTDSTILPYMKYVTGGLKKDTDALKKLLPAEDILTFEFVSSNGLPFVCVYADAITDKELLGEQLIRPLLHMRENGRQRRSGKTSLPPNCGFKKS